MNKYNVNMSGYFTVSYVVAAEHEDEAKEKSLKMLNESDFDMEVQDIDVWGEEKIEVDK